MEKQLSEYKQITNLERDQNGGLTYAPFVANGKKYRFIKPGDPIGIKKWTMYEQLKVVVGTGKTFGEIATYLKDHKALLGSDKPFADIRVEAILETDSMQKSIVELSKERYNQAFYLCSIFIYLDGSDPYTWDFETAGEMIEDWEAERINELDLFFFCQSVDTRIQSDIQRIAGGGGSADGKIVGRFYIESGGRVRPFSEKVEDDFRHGVEFLIRATGYTEQDLMKKDFLTFLKILKEAEAQEAEAVRRMEQVG